jgi:hypothetical protein
MWTRQWGSSWLEVHLNFKVEDQARQVTHVKQPACFLLVIWLAYFYTLKMEAV